MELLLAFLVGILRVDLDLAKLVHNQTVGNDSHNQQNGDDFVAVGQEAVPVSDFGLHVFDFAEACML